MKDTLGYRRGSGVSLGPFQGPLLGTPSTAQETYHVHIVTHKWREVWGQMPLRTEPSETKSLLRPHKSSEEVGQGCLSPECWFCETQGNLGFCRPP